MKILIALTLSAVSLLAADEVVFRGTPTVRLIAGAATESREKLDGEGAKKSECVITVRGKNKYFWASRNNVPMMRVDAPQFTYFIHAGGAGYVKVYNGERKAVNAPADYIETISQGFEVITYWGRAEPPDSSSSGAGNTN